MIDIPQLNTSFFFSVLITSIIYYLLFFIIFRKFLSPILGEIDEKNNHNKKLFQSLKEHEKIYHQEMENLVELKKDYNFAEKEYLYLTTQKHYDLFVEERKLMDSSFADEMKITSMMYKNKDIGNNVRIALSEYLNSKNT